MADLSKSYLTRKDHFNDYLLNKSKVISDKKNSSHCSGIHTQRSIYKDQPEKELEALEKQITAEQSQGLLENESIKNALEFDSSIDGRSIYNAPIKNYAEKFEEVIATQDFLESEKSQRLPSLARPSIKESYSNRT